MRTSTEDGPTSPGSYVVSQYKHPQNYTSKQRQAINQSKGRKEVSMACEAEKIHFTMNKEFSLRSVSTILYHAAGMNHTNLTFSVYTLYYITFTKKKPRKQ
jgi:hypothetical protein